MDIDTINTLLKEIIDKKILKKGVVNKILKIYNKTHQDIIDLLIEYKADKKEVLKILANLWDMNYVDLSKYDPSKLIDYTEIFTKSLSDRYNAICFAIEGKAIKVAFYEKLDPFYLNAISMSTKFEIIPYLAYKGDILKLKEILYSEKNKDLKSKLDDDIKYINQDEIKPLPLPKKSKNLNWQNLDIKSSNTDKVDKIELEIPSNLKLSDSVFGDDDYNFNESKKNELNLTIDSDVNLKDVKVNYNYNNIKIKDDEFNYSKSKSKLNKILQKNKFSLIVSLPENDVNFAKLAFSAGADAVKVHMNVMHQASHILFSNFDIEMKKIREILSVLPIPVGIVPGEEEMASLKEFERMQALGVDFIDVYYQYYRTYMFNLKLAKIVSLNPDFLNSNFLKNQIDLIEKYLDPVAYELSLIDHKDYGKDFTLKDLLLYSKIKELTNRPLLVSTQKKIKPEDIYYLYSIGIKGIIIGVIVIGKKETDFAFNIQKYRKAINEFVF